MGVGWHAFDCLAAAVDSKKCESQRRLFVVELLLLFDQFVQLMLLLGEGLFVSDLLLQFAQNEHRAPPLDATGDLTDTAEIKWMKSRGTPYVPSPLLYEGLLYFNQSNNPIMSCLDTETGDMVIDRTRMPGIKRLYASPVGANGRIYFAGRDGTTLVLERGRKFKIIVTNELDEGVDASPALESRNGSTVAS